MKELKYLNKYLLKYKWHLSLGVLFMIISNFFAVFPAQVVRYAFNLVKENIEMYRLFDSFDLQAIYNDTFGTAILLYGGLIILLALGRGLFLFLVRQTIIVMSRLVEYDLKNEIYNHYQNLPLSFYRRNNTGDIMNRISEDVSKVRMYVGPAIMYSANLITLFLIVIPIMFNVNATLTWYSLIPLPFLSVSIYFVNNLMNKRSEEIQQSQSQLSTMVQEAFSGIRVLKSFVREDDSLRNFTKESNNYKHRSLRLTFVNALFFPLIMGMVGLSVILVVYVGGVEVMNGGITAGNIAEFIIYVNLLTWPVTSVGWVTSIIQRAAASQKRINEFLNTKTDIVSEKNLEKDIDGNIGFKNVSFVYPDSGIKALKGVNFTVKQGETLAVIGTTGSGKSTIANLITRMYDTTSGEIFIDDVAIQDYKVSNLRGQIGYVPQDVFLFSDSIRNNIAFGATGLTEEQMLQASKDADLHNNILDFPKKYETMLGERGITLSGGQKQRVSIARAIARDPKIMIFDDALSAVDTKTENAILNALQKIMVNRTSIVISHRVSSAKLADYIIVLDDGEIIEQGTEEELLALNGTYKELYQKQLQGETVDNE
ncbi:ABC transporter ATP-binding protein [Marivirga atlantica]|uniref:ABC transporter ATP-binding protein n=1 Tax=Marivirga atlantica TaxID=1548457 RepID=A0A937AD61_9BACT|nr:ABC transporter ATP-binding protein [Marivirga atlantica]MBL0766796.1 ABC transporter ATP-binding protein [Marivirga atlantica]